jgi:hypothetical protein
MEGIMVDCLVEGHELCDAWCHRDLQNSSSRFIATLFSSCSQFFFNLRKYGRDDTRVGIDEAFLSLFRPVCSLSFISAGVSLVDEK